MCAPGRESAPPIILVDYGRKSGSRREVANAAGAVLRERGLEFELSPAREVRDLDRYAER